MTGTRPVHAVRRPGRAGTEEEIKPPRRDVADTAWTLQLVGLCGGRRLQPVGSLPLFPNPVLFFTLVPWGRLVFVCIYLVIQFNSYPVADLPFPEHSVVDILLSLLTHADMGMRR
jgi:hypothetical protein